MIFPRLFIPLCALLFIFAGCDAKKEQPAAPKSENPVMVTPDKMPQDHPQAKMPPTSPHGEMPKAPKTVTVPDSVKGKWSKVKIVVEDRSTKKSTEYMVNLGSDLTIPGTTLKVAVKEFLPDFTMDGNTMTSKSNDLNNPALRIEVFEDGKSIHSGWLYIKFPQIHPFEHPRYGITLKEAVRS